MHHLSLPVVGALSTNLSDAWRRIDALLVEQGIEALVGTCAPHMGTSLTWGRSHPGGAITLLTPKASLSCALRILGRQLPMQACRDAGTVLAFQQGAWMAAFNRDGEVWRTDGERLGAHTAALFVPHTEDSAHHHIARTALAHGVCGDAIFHHAARLARPHHPALYAPRMA